MSDETQDLDEMLGFLAEDGRQRRDPEEHPSPEKLSAYRANELTPEEDERIQDHLAVCQHCTELLLDLEEFLKPPAMAAAPAADFEAAADWRRLREGMPREAVRQSHGFSRQGIQLSPLAASLFLALLLGSLGGMSWWNLDLRSRIVGLRAPQLVEDPVRLEGTRGDTLRAAVGKVQDFELVSSHPASFPKYQVEITAEDGQVLWSQVSPKGQTRNPHLILMPGSLDPGLYHIRLSGIQGKQMELLETYTLRIEP